MRPSKPRCATPAPARRPRRPTAGSRACRSARGKPAAAPGASGRRSEGKTKRYDLGSVTLEGDTDIAIGLKTARSRAYRIKEICSSGRSPLDQLAAWKTGQTVDEYRKSLPPPVVAVPSWTWDQAKINFLADVKLNNRPDTLRDYRGKLAAAELAVFDGRMVNTLTRNEIMLAIDAVSKRGVDDMAAGIHRTVRRMMNWLAEPQRQDQTGVRENLLLQTKTSKPVRVEEGEFDDDPEDENVTLPTPEELGRALAIATSGVLPPRTALGIQMLLGTVQRRRTILRAKRWSFRRFPEMPSEQAWSIPPYWRKSGSKRGSLSHVVPCVGWCAGVILRLDKLADTQNNWMFPGAGDGDEPCDIEMLNRALETLPGVGFSPHPVRHAFATYGERHLGFAKSEAKLILDHLEGTASDDVTGQFYSSDPQIQRKREMMLAWTAWVSEQAFKALAADPLLSDRSYLREEIYRRRHGDEKLAKRIAYRTARGWPLWPDGDEREAAE